MGVRGLFHYCKPFLKSPDIHNKRIGIDASSLLYKFYGDFDKIFKFLEQFKLNKNKIIFVFDGKAPKYKEKELEIRKNNKESANIRINLLKESLYNELNSETIILIKNRIDQLSKDNWYLTYDIKQAFKQELYNHNYIFVKSIQEADSLLIDMYYNNYIDAVLSNDMDYLVAGIETLLIPTNNSLNQINLKEILDKEEINIEQFKEVAILCGIDNVKYIDTDNVSYVMSLIRHYGSILNMNEKYPSIFYEFEYKDIQETKKRYYPNKSIYVYLKPEHKDRLDGYLVR